MPDPEHTDTLTLNYCLGVIGLLIYQIFGIIYLVDNYNKNTCITSHVWVYVLISLVLTLSHSGVLGNLSKENAMAPFCLGLLNVGLGVWGNFEVMDTSCFAMHENNLWKFGFATFILQYIAGAIYLIIGGCCICIICQEEYSYRGGYNEV